MTSRNMIELVEVGPRDGLQNESKLISADRKVDLINALSVCGFRRIECGSFVSSKRVPQMADSRHVFQSIQRSSQVSYAALIPNLRGLDAAVEAGVDEVAVFASATEGFARANTNSSVEESLERISRVCKASELRGFPVRGYISCAVACPFDGPTKPKQVAMIAARLSQLGCYEISLGDTIGAGRAETIGEMIRAVLHALPAEKLAGHFHDTGGNVIENIRTAIELGVRTFDTSIGGLGGCPFAPGAPGNADTLKVHTTLTELGFATGLDKAALVSATGKAAALIGES